MSETGRLPDFLIVGAAKCGTTTLWSVLREHPDIFMPDIKEPQFFARDERYHGRGLDWYRSCFAGAAGVAMAGEATPYASNLQRYQLIADRIAEILPRARLIYISRDPITQLPSWYLHHVSRGNVTKDFSEVLHEDWFLSGAAHYARIRPFLERFGGERMLLLCLEDLQERPADVVAACDRFLGVDPQRRPEVTLRRENVSAQKKYSNISRALAWARGMPGARYLKSTLNAPTRRRLKRMFNRIGRRRPLPPAPAWNENSFRYAQQRLEKDARAYLSAAGRPPGRWRIVEAKIPATESASLA